MFKWSYGANISSVGVWNDQRRHKNEGFTRIDASVRFLYFFKGRFHVWPLMLSQKRTKPCFPIFFLRSWLILFRAKGGMAYCPPPWIRHWSAHDALSPSSLIMIWSSRSCRQVRSSRSILILLPFRCQRDRATEVINRSFCTNIMPTWSLRLQGDVTGLAYKSSH